MARMGLYLDAPPLPCVVGYEGAGVVESLGEGATGFAVGDRVLVLSRFGGYSSHVCVPAIQAIKLPDHVSFETAAAIPVNYITAWLMLVHLGNVRKGQRVLVHAAAGGVGQAALQICNWRGAEVIGTASQGKHERLKSLGVAHCIDYHTQDFEAEVARITNGQGVDFVLDAVGGKSYKKSYRALRALGTLYCFGASSLAPGQKRSLWSAATGLMHMPRFSAVNLMNDNKAVVGVNLGHLWDRTADLQEMMKDIVSLVSQGVFAPVVDKVFPFSQAADAHAYIQSHKNFGKVLLAPDAG
jgi:NADPH:quinone reductase-like Zn-dependent oxidoreductase